MKKDLDLNLKMITCDICGYQFIPANDKHYIARDDSVSGLASGFGCHDEPNIYDAYDCPSCGCQYIAKSRKRRLDGKNIPVEEEDTDDDE